MSDWLAAISQNLIAEAIWTAALPPVLHLMARYEIRRAITYDKVRGLPEVGADGVERDVFYAQKRKTWRPALRLRRCGEHRRT